MIRPMTDDEKLLAMFHAVHGEYSNNFSVEVVDDLACDGTQPFVRITKGEKGVCGEYRRDQILFDYITMNWQVNDNE